MMLYHNEIKTRNISGTSGASISIFPSVCCSPTAGLAGQWDNCQPSLRKDGMKDINTGLQTTLLGSVIHCASLQNSQPAFSSREKTPLLPNLSRFKWQHQICTGAQSMFLATTTLLNSLGIGARRKHLWHRLFSTRLKFWMCKMLSLCTKNPHRKSLRASQQIETSTNPSWKQDSELTTK